MVKLLAEEGVIKITSDMCRFGLAVVQSDKETGEVREELAMKPTGWATNSPEIAKQLDKRCENAGKPPEERHRHAKLIGSHGLAKQC